MHSVFLSKAEIGFSIIKERLKEIVDINSKVVIIPWSFPIETDEFGVEEYYKNKIEPKYTKQLLEMGIKEKNIKYLNCYKDSLEYMKKEINSSDILVLTGGNPEMFYNKVESCGLLDTLKNYKKIIIGSSAGTELQLEDYFITAKNNYYKKFDWYKGFGIINNTFFTDVHSINDEEYLEQLKNITKNKKKDVYAIFDDGAIIYNRISNQIETYGNVIKYSYKDVM
ncbi:MAG: hypothetical protein E7163_04845 [Firmicutes bacterium]|nr:hypothetical protein [Bacillota bacterium]